MRNYQVQGNLFVEESRLCEFLIILPLPNEVREQAMVFKEEFEVLFGRYSSRYSIPHITICDFLLFEHRTYDIMTFFKKRLQSLNSFSLKLNGFDSFDNSKTIYMGAEESERFENLQDEVDVTRRMLKLRKNYFQSNRPFIPIAKNLPYDMYVEAREVFSKREFNYQFEVTKMQILKFDFITRKYQLFGEIPLS